MPLTREQLDDFDAKSQNEIVQKIAGDATGFVDKLLNPAAIVPYHLADSFGLVPNSLKEYGQDAKDFVLDGTRSAVHKMAEIDEVRSIVEAVEQFISSAIDYITKSLGFQTDRQKVIDGFKESAEKIEPVLQNLPEDVDKSLVRDGVIKGLRDAGSSISALQEQVKEEATDVVGDVTGEKQSKADEVAASAAASTYQRVYKNLVDDYKDKNPGATAGDAFDDARRKAHETAARVAGVYMKEDGTFEPAKDGDGKYFGMFGFVHEGIKQVEAKQEVSASFRLAPPDEIARAATRQPAASPTDEVIPPSVPAPETQRAPAIAQ